MAQQPRFHKPAIYPDLDRFDSSPGPDERVQMAHDLAAMLVADPTRPRDAEASRRFVTLADEHGLETIAGLWSTAPAVSLPGSLWRLYALRTWIHNRSAEASAWFRAGCSQSPAEAVAGIADPPGPAEVADAADRILAGAFRGDYATALDRAAAFVAVAARGRAADDASDPELASFVQLGEDLTAAARAHRAGSLA